MTIAAELYPEIAATASRPDFADWLTQVRATGGCAQPIHLYGQSRTIQVATGVVLAQREEGKLLVACGNRRKTRCPSCSETYRADTFQLIRAGLIGGKNVPDTVTAHPKIFATFTAPSFGPVHHRTLDSGGRPRPCHPYGPHRCGRRHGPGDEALGQPLDPDTYDYVGAVTWNALATKLWARTVQLANRAVARLLGIRQKHWPYVGRVSVAKVAEYQARGLVHFHATFRLDGPEPAAPLPAGATVEVLEEALREAATAAAIQHLASPFLAGRPPVVWGDQLDLRPVQSEAGEGTLSDGQVAGYIAKYATKGAEASGTVDRRLDCRPCHGQGTTPDTGRPCQKCHGTGRPENAHRLKDLNPHIRRMIETCWDLGGRSEIEQLRLRPWAHMLGFRGHFSTKSRRYSTTLGCLRSARRTWQQQRTLAAHRLDPDTPVIRAGAGDDVHELIDQTGDDTVLVIGHWAYTGTGHTAGEAIFAATVAAELAESRHIYRQITRGEPSP